MSQIIFAVETRWIVKLGILSALVYLCAQACQYVIALWPSTALSVVDAIHDQVTPRRRVVSLTILVSFLLLPNYYLAIAAGLARRRPHTAVLGFTFSLMFVFIEILHRSVDYFLVANRWAASLTTATGAARNSIPAQISHWNALTDAVYVPLLAAHFMSSVYFLRATLALDGPWKRILSAALILNCMRLTARLAEIAGDARWLACWNQTVYFPLTLAIFGSFTIWLLAQLKSGGSDEWGRSA